MRTDMFFLYSVPNVSFVPSIYSVIMIMVYNPL